MRCVIPDESVFMRLELYNDQLVLLEKRPPLHRLQSTVKVESDSKFASAASSEDF